MGILIIRVVKFALNPFAPLFHIALACDVLHKIGIHLSISVEEVIAESIDRECLANIFKCRLIVLNLYESFYRCAVEVVVLTENVGETFRVGCSILDVANKRESPLFFVVKNNDGSIKFAPCRVDKLLHKVA